MSHFSVMVVTPNKPTEQTIAEALQPYHEFECTGTVDQYVVDVNITEKALEEYKGSTTRFYVDPNGVRHDPYLDEFYREATEEEKAKNPHMMGCGGGDGISWNSKDWGDGQGYRAKVHFLPEGWQDVRISDEEIKTFAQFVSDYYGYKCISGGLSPNIQDKEMHKFGWYRTDAQGNVTEVIKRTNQNSKWDWYVIGGRWAGKIKLHNEYVPTTAWCGTRSRWDDPIPAHRYDSARKGDINIASLRLENRTEAELDYDKVHAQLGQYITPEFLTWEKMVEKHNKNYDAARAEYGAQIAVVKSKEYAKSIGDHWFDLDPYVMDKDTYLAIKEIQGFSTFAILQDGNWYARGEMLMFGAVADEDSQWEFQFDKIFKEIPDDHWLTIVDCHI